jgi:hypothetical protein
MHLHLAGLVLGLVLVAAILFGLWEVLGLWLVYGPLLLGSLVALVYFGPRLVRMRQEWRQRRLAAQRAAALNLKRKTAAAEAALGMPVPTKRYCPQCGHPLVAGALLRLLPLCGGSGRER